MDDAKPQNTVTAQETALTAEAKKEQHVAPITLLQEQTQLLRDIKTELVHERQRIQREWWIHFLHGALKYVLIAAAVWYLSMSMQTALQQVTGVVPSIDFSKLDPRNLNK